MMTAAAVPAGAGFEVAFLGDAAQFERLAHVLRDGFLHLLHLLLRIEEAAGDGVSQEGFAQFFEFGDFGFQSMACRCAAFRGAPRPGS